MMTVGMLLLLGWVVAWKAEVVSPGVAITGLVLGGLFLVAGLIVQLSALALTVAP